MSFDVIIAAASMDSYGERKAGVEYFRLIRASHDLIVH